MFTEDQIDTTIRGALLSVVYFLRCACDYMIPQGYGKIVNISSESSYSKNNENIVLYAATKSAMNGLTRGLANELAPFGIMVNGVAPGLMFHDQLRYVFDYPTEENLGVRQTMCQGVADTICKRPSLADKVANTVVYLASDANTYIYGQTILNGGGINVF
jgi:3-oxoacyl-[acyl-carrier protein] reductase